MMIYGSHVSIKNGYLGAAKQAVANDASAFQYFPKNPRSLSIKDFDREDAKNCKQFCKSHQLQSIAHTPYSTSLTPSEDKRKLTIASLLNDLEIANACGSIGVVVHYGSQISQTDPLASYHLMLAMLNGVLSQWDGDCLILLENNAGTKGALGTTFEELVQIRNLCDYPEKIGFCLDTCHAFASGLWTGGNSGPSRDSSRIGSLVVRSNDRQFRARRESSRTEGRPLARQDALLPAQFQCLHGS